MTRELEQLINECTLDPPAVRGLRDDGFVVIDGPVPEAELDELAAAYDDVMRDAQAPDKRLGRHNTRVHDLVNRGAAFDRLYVYPPVLAACCLTIGQPFKLSNLLGRTLHANAPVDELHVDVARGQDGWPLLGFILMLDHFTEANGATRFWPGSHRRTVDANSGSIVESEIVSACGPRGALVVYDASTIHGHGSNITDSPRRSIQGAYIPRTAHGFGLAGRMSAATRERIGPLARYLIDDSLQAI